MVDSRRALVRGVWREFSRRDGLCARCVQSSPGRTFQSVAVVSEGSSVPASGLVLKGALMLQQHALLSDVHKEPA